MVDINPFRALRYASKKKTADISKLICPPYDVISPEQREKIIKKSKDNVVQLELPSGSGDFIYLNAESAFRKMKSAEILQRDRMASFYLLETTFKINDEFAPAKAMKRYGVLSALRLETPGKGHVKPHEKTLPKAKTDRLNLLNAVKTNISPIFGLFFDPKKKWSQWVKKCVKGAPISKGSESPNLKHRLWKIQDPQLIKELKTLVKSKELYIADGHHRYEVSWAFKEAQLKNDPGADLAHGWNSVMTYVCPMEEAGLLMLPTHRFVQTNRDFDSWKKHLESIFTISPQPTSAAMIKALKKAKKTDRVIGWVHAEGFFLLKLKKTISLDLVLSHRAKALRDLDVVLIHDLALDEARGAAYIKGKTIFYTQDVKNMRAKAKSDPSWCGFVLRSAGVDSLAKVAGSGEVMPPKTTYFYPKVPTGFTLMPLDAPLN